MILLQGPVMSPKFDIDLFFDFVAVTEEAY